MSAQGSEEGYRDAHAHDVVVNTHQAMTQYFEELGIGEGSVLLPTNRLEEILVRFDVRPFPRGVLTNEGVPCDTSRFETRLTRYIKQSVRAKQWKTVQPRMTWLCVPLAAWILGVWSLEFFAVIGALIVTVVTALYVLFRSPIWYSDATLLAATSDAERREVEDAFLQWYQQQPHLWPNDFMVIVDAEGPEGCKAPLIDVRVKQPQDPQVAAALANAIQFIKKHNLNASLYGVVEALEWGKNPAPAALAYIRQGRPERKPNVYAASVESELETPKGSTVKWEPTWRKPPSHGFVSGPPPSRAKGGVAVMERLAVAPLELPPVQPDTTSSRTVSQQSTQSWRAAVASGVPITTPAQTKSAAENLLTEMVPEPEEEERDPWQEFREAFAPLVKALQEGRTISVKARATVTESSRSSSSSGSSREREPSIYETRKHWEGYDQGAISGIIGTYCIDGTDPFVVIPLGDMSLIPPGCYWGPPEAYNALKAEHDAIVKQYQ